MATTISKAELETLAERYETAAFIEPDPSRFMHQVVGAPNREVTAFVASCLSYGSRKQFLPKIQSVIDMAEGDVFHWIKSGRFRSDFPSDDAAFYRLYSNRMMFRLFESLEAMLQQYGTMKQFVNQCETGLGAIKRFTGYFDGNIVPKDATSACKRLCMFLRWMVRYGSPVDLGLWSDIIDKRTLVIPMDVHVLRQANNLGLIDCKTASMRAAIQLTETLKRYFPDDPLKGDFALFGLGVNSD